jgi:hypothetical protein
MIDPSIVWKAAIDTVEEAGELPKNIEDMPAHMRRWFALMRRADPRLKALRDKAIGSIMDHENISEPSGADAE